MSNAGGMAKRLTVAVVLGLMASVLVLITTGTPVKAAGTTSVACGNVAALTTAINNANANVDADTIDITGAPCTFTITVPAVNAGANGNSTGLPLVTTPITILGHGATIERSAALPATTTFRILFANTASGNLNLQDLTIKGGLLNSGNVGAGLATFGGASCPSIASSSPETQRRGPPAEWRPTAPAFGPPAAP